MGSTPANLNTPESRQKSHVHQPIVINTMLRPPKGEED